MKDALKALVIRPSEMRPGYLDAYETALRDAGIEPVIVGPDEKVSLDGVDGLLVVGGSDVNPKLYGQQPAPECGAPDDARDAAELRAIAEAVNRDLPVLAICRGMQILNVQHGGSLVQHLESAERHRTKEEDLSKVVHALQVEPESRLARILEAEETIGVNSRHHQAIDRLGADLRVTARDPEDGTIEAVERPDKRFVIGVEWHPEDQSRVREDQARLFQAFADAMHETGE